MRFIAYFDYLGFKDFILNNPIEVQKRILGNNYRDMENALARMKLKEDGRGRVVADLDNSKLHCINFSDTVLFYTKDGTFESLKELLEAANQYNHHCNVYFFPIRGAIVYGEFIDVNFNQKMENDNGYHVNSVYGKALISAYYKAESQSWAGTVIDDSVVTFLEERGFNSKEILSEFAKLYSVPYKNTGLNFWGKVFHFMTGKRPKQEEEWVMNLSKLKEGEKLGNTAFQNLERNVRENFAKHKKRIDIPKVKRMIQNTVSFLKSYT